MKTAQNNTVNKAAQSNKADKVATVATVKANKAASNKKVVAQVEKVATVKAERVSLNSRGRDTIELQGVAVNSCGSFVGRDNVSHKEVDFLIKHMDAIKEQIVNGKSKTVWHVTRGSIGVHAGKAELFANVKVGDETRDILRRAEGSIYTDKVSNGFQVLTDSELLAMAREKSALTQVRVKARLDGGGWTEGEKLQGAMVGSLSERKQILLYRTSGGIAVKCLTTAHCAAHENEQTVLIGKLDKAEADKLALAIFKGVKEERTKTRNVNKVRAARAATVAKAKA